MSTALQLTNRVKVKMRVETGTVITDDASVAILDNLNQAVTEVLEEHDWEFHKRSDGVLSTIADETGADAVITNGDATVSITTWTGALDEDNGDFILSINFSDDGSYGDVSFDFDTAEISGGVLTGELTTAFPGTTDSTATYRTFVYQYTLPTTVRRVIQAWDQEGDELVVIEDEDEFRALVPRPHVEINDRPRVIAVGGTINKTRATTSDTETYGTRLLVWPVPDSKQIINYSYVYQQAVLSAATDELINVPAAVEDLIVDLAYAKGLVNIEDDPQRGFAFERRVRDSLRNKFHNHRPDRGKRQKLLSLDEIGSRPTSLHRREYSTPTLTLGTES